MTYLQAIILGIIQGVTEPFPVSSLGHSVILPSLFQWNINQNNPFFLVFLVATHAATALVFLIIFRKDWIAILKGMGRSLRDRVIEPGNYYGRLGWLLVVGTIPAGILGLLLEKKFNELFGIPEIAAVVLIVNGLMLFGADALRKKRGVVTEEKVGIESGERVGAGLSWWASVKIGCLQCLALIPGFSRTGATITGGLMSDLSYEDAARFSFLLATPIIGAAAALKLPELWTERGAPGFSWGIVLVGAIAAALFAYLSVKFLLNYFETKKLWPFGLYCCVVGVVVLLLIL